MSNSVDKVKYLSWNATSIKALINQKLSARGTFTDHLYEDSNLSGLIDIFAHTFEVMTYIANNGASESIFTDSMLYENINRLSKMLGYNPKGIIASTVPMRFNNPLTSKVAQTPSKINVTIPMFTTIGTQKTQYSFTSNFKLSLTQNDKTSNSYVIDDITEFPILTNGIFKLYPITFTAQGVPFETFLLNSIPSLSAQKNSFPTHNHFHVYVNTPKVAIDSNVSTLSEWEKWNRVDSLLYSVGAGESDRGSFELRLNENYIYELKFGDGVLGKRLIPGSQIYIVYLESYGSDGIIQSGKFEKPKTGTRTGDVAYDNIKIKNATQNLIDIFTCLSLTTGSVYTKDVIKTAMGIYDGNSESYFDITLYNDQPSTDPQIAETVESIRENAPNWFRTGGRLITKNDHNIFVKNLIPTLTDVVTMNNFEYMTTFQKWLDKYGKLKIDIRRHNYKYADSCDFNNVYIWLANGLKDNPTDDLNEMSQLKQRNAMESYIQLIRSQSETIKTLTSEIVPVLAVYTNFTPCCKNPSSLDEFISKSKKEIASEWGDAGGFGERCRIHVYKNRNSMIPVESIKENVYAKIENFFNSENCRIGMVMDFGKLTADILTINGIVNIRTAYYADPDPADPVKSKEYESVDGLYFAKWSMVPVDAEDLEIFSGACALEAFQFPKLINKTALKNMITIKTDNYSISEISY